MERSKINTDAIIAEANMLGQEIDAYAESNIPPGGAFDDAYRGMMARLEALVSELRARGISDDHITQTVHCPEG